MKPALIVIAAVLLLSACNANKTAATNGAQGASAAASSKVTPKRTSPHGRVEALGKGRAKSAPLIENERGGDPNKSALNAQIHP